MKHKMKHTGFTRLGKWRIFLILALILALSIILIAGGNNEVPVQVIGGDVELRVFGRHENNIVMLLEDSGKLLAYYKDGSCSFAKKPQKNFKLSAKKEERLNGKINRLSALTF